MLARRLPIAQMDKEADWYACTKRSDVNKWIHKITGKMMIPMKKRWRDGKRRRVVDNAGKRRKGNEGTGANVKLVTDKN